MCVGAEDGNILRIQTHSEVIRYLSAGGDNHAVRLFVVQDVEHTLKRQLVEVQTVAHVIVRRHGLRIVVYHDTAVAAVAYGVQCLHTAPVELHRRADTVSSRTEHHHRTAVVLILNVVGCAAVCEIQVVCLCRIFGCQCVNLLDHGNDAQALAVTAYIQDTVIHIFLQTYGAGNLEVAEAIHLCTTQQVGRQVCQQRVVVAPLVQLDADVHDVHQLVEEPAVNLRQVMYVVNAVSRTQCLRDDQDALVRRLTQSLVYIGNLQLLVLREAVQPLPYHAYAFLNGFLERASYGHDLSYRLHARA